MQGVIERERSSLAISFRVRSSVFPETVICSTRFARVTLETTGFSVSIPKGFEIQIRPRSGLAAKKGISVLNTPGTIDSDYRGELKVILINLGKHDFSVTPGMRIAQLIIAPSYKAKINFVKEISSNSKRGKLGFGSTGL